MGKRTVIGRQIVEVQLREWRDKSTHEKYDNFKQFTVHGKTIEEVFAILTQALQV